MTRKTGSSLRVPRAELAPGYAISRVVHGGWQLSQGHRSTAVDASAALRTLSRLAEAGFTTFDCADIYTGVEELFGRFLADRRSAGRYSTPASAVCSSTTRPSKRWMVRSACRA